MCTIVKASSIVLLLAWPSWIILVSNVSAAMASMSSAAINRGVGQVALVTGANRGIGKEVCRQLAELGDYDHIFLGSRSIEKGEEAVKSLLANINTTGQSSSVDGSKILSAIEIDVTDPSSINQAVKEIDQRAGGKLDVLVNNAGINYDLERRATSVEMDFVRSTMETNLYGPWNCVQGFLPLLEKSDNPRIVNVSSGAGSLSGMSGGTPAYGVSKAALNALTLKLAEELPHMRVNAVCPGWIATDMGGPGGGPIGSGGISVVWACQISKDGPTGGFFRNGKPVEW